MTDAFYRIREIIHAYDEAERGVRETAERAIASLAAPVDPEPLPIAAPVLVKPESVTVTPKATTSPGSFEWECSACGYQGKFRTTKDCKECQRTYQREYARRKAREKSGEPAPMAAKPNAVLSPMPDHLAGIAIADRMPAEQRERLNVAIHEGTKQYVGIRFDVHQDAEGNFAAVSIHNKPAEGSRPVLRVERINGKPYAKFFGGAK